MFLGLLLLGEKKSGRSYSGVEIQILATLSNYLAVAVENALMYESIQESKGQLQALFNKVIQSERLAAIGEMTAVLAHEIKNPLGVIRSSAEFLTQSPRSPEVQEELLQYIVEEIDSLTIVVNNIMGLARYKPPELRPIDPVEHLKSLLTRWQTSVEHNPKVSLSLEKHYTGPPIYADGNQVTQVVMNLIKNGEEAMVEGGRLDIGILDDAGGRGVLLTFRDSGPGIAEDRLADVFKKFFTSKESGLGLGLAVCEQIVRSHQGSISIANNEGHGATVTVWLPHHPLGSQATQPDVNPS
jgi:signal transduction histidine kinase